MSSDLEQEHGSGAGAGQARRSFDSLTGRQRVLLVLALIGLPLALFLLLEAGLRLGGYGSDYPLFVPVEAAPEYLRANPRVAQRYFRHEAGTPRPMVDLFRAEKRPGAYRVFVQGGSTTAGFPYNHGGAFSRMLEQRLQATFPDTEIEVVNVSLDATNSYALRDLAPEIREHEPDAVLIYAGHNEYYGVLGVASAETAGRAPWLVRAYIDLRRLRTVQWLQGAIDRGAGALWSLLDRSPPPSQTLMEYLASEHTVRHGSSLYQAGISQFRRNLDALLRGYADAGVPVFIGTLASNERGQPPFVSRPAPATDSADWAALIETAGAALDRGDSAAAGAAINAALAMDSTAADPFFFRGRLLDRYTDYDAARTAYRAARDRDQLPFRAPTAMNDVLRNTASRHGAVVVETLEALAGASRGGIVDNTVMLEHLHPNIDGQFLLADAFYRALRDADAIGEWTAPVPADEARARIPVTAVDSLAGAYMIDHLTSRFPFQPAGTRARSVADTLEPRTRIEELALAYHQGELPWLPAMDELQKHYHAGGQWERVAHVNRVMAQEVPYSPVPLVTAAEAAGRAGRDADALRDLEAARARQPTSEGARLMGDIAARRGDPTAARRHYAEAARLDPTNRQASAALRAIDAIDGLERAVQADPGDLDAVADLGITYFLTGRYGRAEELVTRVLRQEPSHPGALELARRLRSAGQNPNE